TNVRLAAVRRLADEAADAGLLSPELAAGIRRVKGSKRLGVRLGNRLTAEQARSLPLAAPKRRDAKKQAGSSNSGSFTWLRASSSRTVRPYARPSPASRRALGHHGSGRKG